MIVRARLRALFDAAVGAVSAEAILPAHWPEPPLSGRLAIIAAGKAAGAMMQVAEARATGPISGLAITRYGHLPPHWQPGRGIEVVEAGHPVPDEASLYAGRRALALATSLDAGDTLLVLLSGGGSALLAAPNDWIITSSEALRGLAGLVRELEANEPGHGYMANLQHQRLVVPHARIAETARALGFDRLTLSGSGDERLLAAIQSHA